MQSFNKDDNVLKIKDVNKTFRVLNRSAGLTGIIRDIVSPSYKQVNALSNVNLDINKGEQICLIGRNGAGKSTLIKLISSIIRPASGEIMIDGQSIHKNPNAYKKRIGVFFGNRSQLSFELALRESLLLQGSIYGMKKPIIKDRISELSSMLELNEILNRPVREMSLGQRIRSEIALTLMHSPEILLLDEPTIGLDLEFKDMFYNVIKNSVRKQNLTLILTSHDVNDIRELADRLLIINEGKIVFDGAKEKFFEKFTISKKAVIEFSNAVDINEISSAIGREVSEQIDSHTIALKIDSNKDFIRIMEKLSNSDIHEVKIIEDDMYSILLQYYKGEIK